MFLTERVAVFCLAVSGDAEVYFELTNKGMVLLITIIIIFINCNWIVTRWQWLFYMYTKYEIGY